MSSRTKVDRIDPQGQSFDLEDEERRRQEELERQLHLPPGKRRMTELLARHPEETERFAPGKRTRTLVLAGLAPATEAPDAAALDAAPIGPLLVDDGVVVPDRLQRSEFLALLRRAVIEAGQAALGPSWVSAGCPYIERWFAAHAGADAELLDRMARRFSGVRAPRFATDYLPGIRRRIIEGVLRWRDGGDVTRDLDAAGIAPVEPTLRDLGQGKPIDPGIAAKFGDALGADLSDVRVHTGPRAAAIARDRDALAFTVGRNVAFAEGAYRPGSLEGDALLAHELAHAVQQGAVPADARLPDTAPEGGAHELDADRAAAGVLGRLYRGARGAASRVAPALRTGPQLQRCKPDATPPPGASLTIGKVAFKGSDNRVAPTKTADVAVDVKGLPSGKSVDFDIDGSGGGNGTATITAGASLTASGTVTVKGGTQTGRGKAGSLFVRAKIDGTEVGKGPGFTVAAWPENWTDSRHADLDDGTFVGIVVQDGWSSDGGGAVAELGEVEIKEVVGIVSGYPNPPFKLGIGRTSGYLPANALTTDTHGYPRTGFELTGLAHGTYTQTRTQLSLFKDARTGVTDKLMPNSGMNVIHEVKWNPGTSKWNHKTTKVGAAVTIGSHSATAGSGTSTSDVHVL